MAKRTVVKATPKQEFDFSKFNFELNKGKLRTPPTYDVRLVTFTRTKEGSSHKQYANHIYLGKFWRDNNLRYTKVSIGVNGKGKNTDIIMVFDNNHFNNDNLEVKNPEESPRVGTARIAISKILSALDISEKDQNKGIEITWKVELVDAKHRVYRLKDSEINILSK